MERTLSSAPLQTHSVASDKSAWLLRVIATLSLWQRRIVNWLDWMPACSLTLALAKISVTPNCRSRSGADTLLCSIPKLGSSESSTVSAAVGLSFYLQQSSPERVVQLP